MNAPTTAAARHLAAPQPRLNFQAVAPELYQAQAGINAMLRQSSLGLGLLELVFLRASQINGCAYCLDVHTADARKGGENERRLATLGVWRETPFFTERERAALEWAESLTVVAEAHVPDDVWVRVAPQFSAAELVDLTLLVNAINAWNRFAIAFRKRPV